MLENLFSGETSLLVTLLFFTAVIAIYGVFVYYFYTYLAKKNIIELNLAQYNQSAQPGTTKFFAAIFYIIEYIILLPIATFIWFAVLSILILLLAEGIEIATILLISAALVASVRITAYINQTLSKDLAKMLPFTLLAIAITKPGFFQIDALLSRISEIPSLFSNILFYLVFIIAIELVMRGLELISNIYKKPGALEEEAIEEQKSEEQ